MLLFNDTAPTQIYTLSLHDALPIYSSCFQAQNFQSFDGKGVRSNTSRGSGASGGDRKSTRLNSSHPSISYAVFCLNKNTFNTFNRRSSALIRGSISCTPQVIAQARE